VTDDVTHQDAPEPAAFELTVESDLPAGLKPGWRTTEFWATWPLVVVAALLPLLASPADVPQAIVLAAALLAGAWAGPTYAASRSRLKSTGEGKSTAERRAEADASARVYEQARADAQERWRARAHEEVSREVRRASGQVERVIPNPKDPGEGT